MSGIIGKLIFKSWCYLWILSPFWLHPTSKVKVWHCSCIYYRYMTEYYISVPWPLLSGWIEIFWDQHIAQKLTATTMFDDNPKVGHSLESYMTGAHRWWKQSIGWTLEAVQASNSVSKWTGRSTSTPPTKPHICKLEMSNKFFSLWEGLQIEIEPI